MKIKEITTEELDALVKEGYDVVCALIVQNKYTPISPVQKVPWSELMRTSKLERRKIIKRQKEEEKVKERLRGLDIKRAYQLWYSKALVVVRQLLPFRTEDFESFYRFPAKRSDITVLNYRVADLMLGIGLPNECHWRICYSLIKAQCDILESAKAFIDPSKIFSQPAPQADMTNSTDSEIVFVARTDSAPSCKAKRNMDSTSKETKQPNKKEMSQRERDVLSIQKSFFASVLGSGWPMGHGNGAQSYGSPGSGDDQYVVDTRDDRAWIPSKFTIFWKKYPNKADKKYAMEAFTKIIKRQRSVEHFMHTLMSSLEFWRNTEEWKLGDMKSIPKADTWLEDGRWEDSLHMENPPNVYPVRSTQPLEKMRVNDEESSKKEKCNA